MVSISVKGLLNLRFIILSNMCNQIRPEGIERGTNTTLEDVSHTNSK